MDAPEPDERLMCRYRDGDAGAFESLYERHRGGLFRFVLRQIGDRAQSEELFQDIWMKVIDARGNYTPDARFTTWLYRLARNHLIDNFRRRAVRPVTEASTVEPADREALQPERQAETDGRLSRLVAAVEALPDEQRTVFLMRQEGGLSVPEIAAATGVSLETTKSRLRYALRRLRDAVGERDD